MQYYCPHCGIIMEGLYCECDSSDGLHLVRKADDKIYCTRCNKPLDPKRQEIWKKEWRIAL